MIYNSRFRLVNGPAPAQTTGGQVQRFWNIASTGDDSGEILLYGDVLSQRPIDWWTGELEPGLYITPEGFLEDLEAVKGKNNITIKINSCGGDVYTGIAIHNAIKALSGHKTVIVEGIAASAASVIMCAGDDVQVYPGSMVMIHGVSGMLWDYYTLADLKKLQKCFDANEKAIAEIYHAKTGTPVDKLRDMMSKETWMVGQEAVDNGFANVLLDENAGLTASISADKKVMLVAGVRHNVSAFHSIPGSIPVNNSIHAAPVADGNTTTPAVNNITGEKNKKEDKPMTLEELRAQHGDLVVQIENQAAANAINQERARLQAIESIEASVGDTELVRNAKYGENPCTAEQLAFQAMQKQAALGTRHLAGVAADNAASGVNGVTAAPNGGAPTDKQEQDKADLAAVVAAYNKTNGGIK